ncbi:F-box/LRR-repeat protein 5 [Dissostichus eleginoides]|uniref:F-box/LRR-repeat protein 5 n=1 Tax=Dissostichus eleginoides TaxID=100907 RepID=A0AAD9CAS5_DISEL|nr:F-box/LRR-repeat protein 5 [Dissostichus eleginoides]
MSPFPDEQLVGLYCDKLSKTNFSNNNDFRSFLQSLCATFKEFKMHEQIENEFIIGLLQERCCTVYNVHSDNKLSEMLSLFEKGLHNVKSEYEQLNYGRQLKEKLEAFTQDFLPHMKEEEEVFQPMLMQYFSYEELKDLKKQVIAQHCSRHRAADRLKGFSLWSQAEELQKAFKYADHEKTHYELEKTRNPSTHISQLPAEILLRLFHFLSPAELLRCSQVCRSWSELAQTGSLWRHLFPVHWARGDYYSGPPGDLDQEPDEEWVSSRQKEGRAYQEWDEDADVDESDESLSSRGCLAITTAQREKRLLNGLIQNLLPAVGPSVRSVVLAYSSTVSSKMVRQILSFCPNISHLDLTQTAVTDSAFDSWSSSPPPLKHLDLSGCEQITDGSLRRLSRKKRQNFLFKQKVWLLDSSELADIEDAAEWSRRGGASLPGLGFVEAQTLSGAAELRTKCSSSSSLGGPLGPGGGQRTETRRSLKFLSLSGCYQVTDLGLRAVSQRGGLPSLEHLNLSGCPLITEVGLQELVSVCPALNDEHFYYCDNIDGPHGDTASGCQNLQCGFRVCCRSGE